MLRDWGASHGRLVPGFVVATGLAGDDRIVTFDKPRHGQRGVYLAPTRQNRSYVAVFG